MACDEGLSGLSAPGSACQLDGRTVPRQRLREPRKRKVRVHTFHRRAEQRAGRVDRDQLEPAAEPRRHGRRARLTPGRSAPLAVTVTADGGSLASDSPGALTEDSELHAALVDI